MQTKLLFRTRFLCGIFIFAAVLLILRLYFVQIVKGAGYQRDATTQYVEERPDTETRATIYFRAKGGELVSAAVMQIGWRVAIQPVKLKDAASTYAKLAALTPVDHDRFFSSAAKLDDPYEDVAFRVDDTSAGAIRALKLPGVILAADQWRYYPGGVLGAQALGFVGYSGTSTTKVGVYGLERRWQETLVGPASSRYVNPFAELFANLRAAVAVDPASQHGSIVTSIEPSVQQQLEKTLNEVMQTYHPEVSGGIVMDPHTGEIVAIAGRPSYDPNDYGKESDPSVYRDLLVEGRYELGSIMKPLTVAAGIDSGAVTPKTLYDDEGCMTISTYKICNFDGKARGVIPIQEVLNQSLNLGAAYVATKTGYPTFTTYMKAFGFGEKTGIDLPEEVTGDISPLGNGNLPAVNYATAAFGQGVAVSPIEIVRALSALGNGGVLPNPHVVTGVKYESGITRSIDSGEGTRVLSATTTQTVTNMLITVFDKGLLNGELKMEHYSIAAKTGTAQIPQKGGGYIQGDVYLHSFFGYFPAHDPRFIVFLFAVKPHGQKYASATLARPFADIAKFLINYYNLAPDR